ncbi:MAG: hydroxyacid dehydrogenase [Alphaproteobacteria bacterium]|nr:hydroxyacid dehydrogenase [Alphaproteobacteria bacterium]
MARVVGRDAEKLPAAEVERWLPEAAAVIGHTDLPAERLARAPGLRAVFNVEGNFLQNVDYAGCFARGIHVLGIGPVFAQPVAEWALGAALDLARGLTAGDRAMRDGTEVYGSRGNRESFVLSGAGFGLIGFGSLGRALLPLLRPFGGRVRIHDPWLPDGFLRAQGAEPASLADVLASSRVLFILAGVTADNAGFLDRARLATIARDAVVVLASRAAVVEFPAFVELANAGAFRAASDVFPVEPVAPDDPVRGSRLLLSSHRAGGLPEVLLRIGEMVVEDLALVLAGLPPVRCQRAERETVARMRSIAGNSGRVGPKL